MLPDFTVSFPADLDDRQRKNLLNIVASEKTLIEHAFNIEEARLEFQDGKIIFPCFQAVSPEHCSAYLEFCVKVMEKARTAKYISAQKKRPISEKYAFRNFLNRIGLSGPKYKKTRKILLENLTGSASRNRA